MNHSEPQTRAIQKLGAEVCPERRLTASATQRGLSRAPRHAKNVLADEVENLCGVVIRDNRGTVLEWHQGIGARLQLRGLRETKDDLSMNPAVVVELRSEIQGIYLEFSSPVLRSRPVAY